VATRNDDRGEALEQSSPRSEHLLVVRLWLERATPTWQWRGFFDHSGTGNRRYFAGLDELMELIRQTISAGNLG
jgi:hypothetical protein